MIITQLFVWGALAAPPRLTPALVDQTRAAARVLITPAPLDSKAAIRTIQTAMTRVQRGLNAYFHAPNLLDARTEALAMRLVFRALRQGKQPPVGMVDDVLRFNPALHDRIAAACEALADRGCALRHRLLALASGPPTATRIATTRGLLPPKDRVLFDAQYRSPAPVSAGAAVPASPRE